MEQLKSHTKSQLSWLPYLVFFTGLTMYFSLFGKYVLFYQEKSSLFIFSSEYFIESYHQPGGPLIYLGKFFSSFFYYPLPGALIISATISLIILLSTKIIRMKVERAMPMVPWLTGFAIFYLQCNYRYLYFLDLGLLLQLFGFWLIIKYLNKNRLWLSLFFLPIWYFFFGSFAFLLSIMLSLHLLMRRDKSGLLQIIALWLINFIVFYWSKEYLFFQPANVLLKYPYSELNTGEQAVPFFIISSLIALLPVISSLNIRLKFRLNLSGKIRKFAFSLISAIIIGLISFTQFDVKLEQYFKVEAMFYQNRFDEIIAYNLKNPSTNSLTIFLNNIALCEKDRLNDMLFNFLQSPEGNTLFLKWEMQGEVLKRGAYFYYTIGMVNEAQRWAYENMVMKGHSPEGLKMLIKTELINGNYRVASKYISLLRRTLFYRKEADAYKSLLDHDEAINEDEDLGEKRSIRIKNDFFSITDDPYINIERILDSDSLNKKAFQYKQAYLLLKKDFKGIEKGLTELQNYDFPKIPVHIEEAALAIALLNNAGMPDTGPYQISTVTGKRWEQYLTTFQQYSNDLKAAEPALRRNFGNTFWYYAFYR